MLAGLAETETNKLVQRLRDRAGQVRAADAAQVLRPPVAADETLCVTALPEPGPHQVYDAVAVPGGVLVALGGGGVRLLTADGLVRAQWSTATDRFVVADHGRAALLLWRGGSSPSTCTASTSARARCGTGPRCRP